MPKKTKYAEGNERKLKKLLARLEGHIKIADIKAQHTDKTTQ